ncbi:MAG: winged helix-turn-helix domain-containing protein [Steroidobacteraceae bacterium]
MNAANEIIHQTMRLKIMSALNALRAGAKLEFQELKTLLEATDGNLGTHLATLEGSGYIAIEKDFVGKKPRTRVAITRAGRRAFEQHVEYLRDVIAGSGGAPTSAAG